MKSFIYFAFVVLTTVGVYAQQTSQQKLMETTKAQAAEISQELNFDDDQAFYLHRVIYSTEETKIRFRDKFSGSEEDMKKLNTKVDEQLEKMLAAKFTETEISKIVDLLGKK